MPYKRPTNLIGRKVYFKMSKKVYKQTMLSNLTPNKLYTLYRIGDLGKTAYIKDDAGCSRYIWIVAKETCPHLNFKTYWILKKKEK